MKHSSVFIVYWHYYTGCVYVDKHKLLTYLYFQDLSALYGGVLQDETGTWLTVECLGICGWKMSFVFDLHLWSYFNEYYIWCVIKLIFEILKYM